VTDDVNNMRLWRVLETIEKRLSGIEGKLEKVIRLEERVTNHEQVISRFGKRLDAGDERMKKVEMWQAEHNPDMIITTLKANADTIDILRGKIGDLEDTANINRGHKDIGKGMLMWATSILAAIVTYQATRGM
jgi:uncharacterized coiled-coil protein SlyX